MMCHENIVEKLEMSHNFIYLKFKYWQNPGHITVIKIMSTFAGRWADGDACFHCGYCHGGVCISKNALNYTAKIFAFHCR